MAISFSAAEVLEMAEKIERNGANFYRTAAERFDNPYIRQLFTELRAWEKKHEEVFATMREQLSRTDEAHGDLDSDEDLSLYLQTMKGLDVFGSKTDPAEDLSGNESMRDILMTAMEKEKASIVYYNALKAFVSSHADQEKVDNIIKEEMHHIRILSQSLEGLS
ncbi:MAG: ferritin family protein [Planctomycetota bacterium]|jgi:rubrerythrin